MKKIVIRSILFSVLAFQANAQIVNGSASDDYLLKCTIYVNGNPGDVLTVNVTKSTAMYQGYEVTNTVFRDIRGGVEFTGQVLGRKISVRHGGGQSIIFIDGREYPMVCKAE